MPKKIEPIVVVASALAIFLPCIPLLKPALSVCSASTVPDIAIRVGAVVMYLAQFAIAYLLLQRATRQVCFSFVVSAAAIWSVYPMSTLYNFAAPEAFFADGSLFCAVMLLVFTTVSEALKERILLSNLSAAALFFSSAVNSATAIVGVIIYAAVASITLYSLPAGGKQIKPVLLSICLAVTIAAAGLLPGLLGSTNGQDSTDIHAPPFICFPQSVDAPLARLSPVPISTESYRRSLRNSQIEVAFPDAPISMPLLLLFIWTAIGSVHYSGNRHPRLIQSLIAMALLALTAFIASLSTAVAKALALPTLGLTCAHALVADVNLFILAGITIAAVFGQIDFKRVKPSTEAILYSLCLLIAGLGTAVELYHADRISSISMPAFSRSFSDGIWTICKAWLLLSIVSMAALLPLKAVWRRAAGQKNVQDCQSRSSQETTSDQNLWPIYATASVLVVILPCAPLLNPLAIFPADWQNQAWMLNYAGAFFKAHHYFSPLINTVELVGMPYPIFYGYLLFPTLALFSTRFEAGLAIRLGCLILYSMQFALLFHFLKAETKNRFYSFSVAAMVTWAIYPMTNLYNRGDIPEFFGTVALTTAIVLGFYALRAQTSGRRFLFTNLSIVTWTFAAGAHAITALFGLFSIVFVAIVGLVVTRWKNLKQLAIAMIPSTILGAICLMPWALAVVSCKTLISQTLARVTYYSSSLDSAYWRLTPWPITTSSIRHGLASSDVHLRHIDTQISVPLSIIFVALLVQLALKKRSDDKRLLQALTLIAVLVALISWSSVSAGTWDCLGALFCVIQDPYRLVTYINLLLLSGILLASGTALATNTGTGFSTGSGTGAETGAGSGREVTDKGAQRSPVVSTKVVSSKVVWLALILAFTAGCIKLSHAQEVSRSCTTSSKARSWIVNYQLLNLPHSFYGFFAYMTPGVYPHVSEDAVNKAHGLQLLPMSDEHFGEMRPLPVRRGVGSLISINLQEFSWNSVVDENNRTAAQLFEYGASYHRSTAIKVPATTAISYSFKPPYLWSLCNSIALPLFEFWLLGSIASTVLLIPKIGRYLPVCHTFLGSEQALSTQKPLT